jgi:hypothetical protein
MQTWVPRLAPEVDPAESLRDACKEGGWSTASVISGVGSPAAARLRLAARP